MQVYDQLAAEGSTLPWEEGRISDKETKKLGKFRKPIMELLQRDPRQRATVAEFCKHMLEIFSTSNPSRVCHKTMLSARWCEPKLRQNRK